MLYGYIIKKIFDFLSHDTTFVCNKLDENLVSNNPQAKTSKISIILDNFNIYKYWYGLNTECANYKRNTNWFT